MAGKKENPNQAVQQVLAIFVILLLILTAWWVWEQYHAQQAVPTTGPVAGERVRLATWNLRQFSERPGIDLRMIAKIINESHFDLVAIQEVKKNGEEVDHLLNVLGFPWRATSFSPMTGNHERFVFIYNGQVLQEIGKPHLIEWEEASIFDRVPYQATFKAGNFDFTLVTVHLSFTNVQRRKQEAESLARYVADLVKRSKEKDVIVLGDFNEQKRSNLHYFLDQGWQSLNHDASNLSSREVFDTLLIDPKHTRQFTGTCAAVRFDEMFFNNDDARAKAEVSDHRPVYADFATTTDDD